MSHGPCAAACAEPAVAAAVPMIPPKTTATAAPSLATLERIVHALTFMRSPCSALSMADQLLALTFRPRRDAGPRQDGPRCFGMQTLPHARWSVKVSKYGPITR